MNFIVAFFLLIFSGKYYFESSLFNYEAEDENYKNNGNFSYEDNQLLTLEVGPESKGIYNIE